MGDYSRQMCIVKICIRRHRLEKPGVGGPDHRAYRAPRRAQGLGPSSQTQSHRHIN